MLFAGESKAYTVTRGIWDNTVTYSDDEATLHSSNTECGREWQTLADSVTN